MNDISFEFSIIKLHPNQVFCHSAEEDAAYYHAVLSSCQSQAGLQTWLL